MLITLLIILGALIVALVGFALLLRSRFGAPIQRWMIRIPFIQRMVVKSMRKQAGAQAAGQSDLEVMLNAMGPEGKKIRNQLRSMSPQQRKQVEKMLWAQAASADQDQVVEMSGRAERRKAQRMAGGGRQAQALRKAQERSGG